MKQPFGDPWMLLTAAALATSNLRLGTMVTPVARRRPEQLARQVATLDFLSGGRVVFCAGLGGPVEDEFASFGDTTDPVVPGGRVNHQGRHYHVRDVTLLPPSVQRPRPPVWIGGFWPHRRPMRRAARWDGVVPLFTTAKHGHVPPLDEVRDLAGYVSKYRDRNDRPFEIVLGGASPGDPAEARDLIASLAEAGATWWDERQLQTSENVYRLTPVQRRIDKGHPSRNTHDAESCVRRQTLFSEIGKRDGLRRQDLRFGDENVTAADLRLSAARSPSTPPRCARSRRSPGGAPSAGSATGVEAGNGQGVSGQLLRRDGSLARVEAAVAD